MSAPHLRLGSALGLALLAASSFAGPVPTGKPAHDPDWWFERDVIARLQAAANKPDPAWPDDYPVADDYAVANLGQLKALATQAAAEFDAPLSVPGAGARVRVLIGAWAAAPASGMTRDDYAALNQGQLKSVASPFYKRLAAAGYTGQPLSSGQVLPWSDVTSDDESFALVNLGQLKRLFSFEPVLVNLVPGDDDHDGLPDAWETTYFNTPAAQTGDSHADGDGLSNRQEYLLGTNPAQTAQSEAPAQLSLIIFAP